MGTFHRHNDFYTVKIVLIKLYIFNLFKLSALLHIEKTSLSMIN